MNNADYQRAFRARQNDRLERIEQGVESLRKDMDFLRKILRKIADPLRKDNEDKSDACDEIFADEPIALPPNKKNPPYPLKELTSIPPYKPPPSFDQWWEAYPDKVGKGAARTAFAKALTKTSLDQLIAGLERYKATKPLDRPWCNPATWLNQERWTDAPATNGHATGQTICSALRVPSSKCGWPACSCSVRSKCQAVNGELHV